MTKPLRVQPRDRAAWTSWLERHHTTAQEVFVVFRRKGTGPTITYDEAVEEALCFGWIDGRKNKLDETRYTLRFTPRGPRSAWSESNKRRIAELGERLRPAGRAAIEAAKQSGAWTKPARTPVPATMPAELTAALRANAAARRAFEALAPSHQREWQRWVDDAKKIETRVRRAARTVEQLASGGKVPAGA